MSSQAMHGPFKFMKILAQVSASNVRFGIGMYVTCFF